MILPGLTRRRIAYRITRVHWRHLGHRPLHGASSVRVLPGASAIVWRTECGDFTFLDRLDRAAAGHALALPPKTHPTG